MTGRGGSIEAQDNHTEILAMKKRRIRLPKPLLEQADPDGDNEISVREDSLMICPVRKPRKGWAASFQQMAGRRDDALMDNGMPVSTCWDEDEWEWE